MTATVTEDAELGFRSPELVHTLLRTRPELCQQLLVIMAERVSDNQAILKALLKKGKKPVQSANFV